MVVKGRNRWYFWTCKKAQPILLDYLKKSLSSTPSNNTLSSHTADFGVWPSNPNAIHTLPSIHTDTIPMHRNTNCQNRRKTQITQTQMMIYPYTLNRIRNTLQLHHTMKATMSYSNWNCFFVACYSIHCVLQTQRHWKTCISTALHPNQHINWNLSFVARSLLWDGRCVSMCSK